MREEEETLRRPKDERKRCSRKMVLPLLTGTERDGSRCR